MDLDISRQAITMTAKDFQKWSSNFALETMKSSGAKQAVDKITAPIWSWGQRNAIYPLEFGIACCSLEFGAAYNPRWDLERLGMIPRASPRQSDVLLVMGWISAKVRPVLRRLYEQMPEPKWVVAMGECAISGGPWYDGY
ncbi:MAG: NADH-quinone oxidoreductase subunit NuoB, partial [Methanomassiliicoccales archaeon]